MIKSIKGAFSNNRKVIENFSYLTFFQFFTLLTPIITYPYLIKTVGLNLYGVVVFSQTIVSYVSLFINFGFGTSGPKDVAVRRDNLELLSKYVSSVYIIKMIFWVICLLIYLISIFTIDFFREHFILYFFSYFVTLGDVLFPIWFFQGIEKMKYITYINLVIKSFFIIAVFIFIKQSSDYIYIPLLNSVGALLSGIIALFIVFKREGVLFVSVSKENLFKRLKESFVLFISTLSIRLYMNLNKIIVGSFLGMKEVAIYDLGEKIVSMLKTPIMMISQSVFPKISREKSIAFINKIMFFVLGFVVFVYFILFFSCEWIVLYFLGTKNVMAEAIIRLLSVSLVFLTFNMFLGELRLITFGHNKEYMFGMVANGIFYAFLMGLLWFFDFINIYFITIAYVLVEVFCTIFLYFINKRLKLLRSSNI